MTTQTETNDTLTLDHIDGFRDGFASDPRYRLMQNTVTQRDVNEVALDHDIVTSASHTFSTLLDEWEPTHQGNSGRCWLFSGLNLFRVDTMKTLNTRQFEYSQNYMMFWDKVERANFVLEAVIETADRPTDDRVLQHLMTAPVEDAGQWDMFVNLVDKYGVVPKEIMPETESSGNTRQMNMSLYYQVRQGAAKIRSLYKYEAGLDAMRQAKLDTLTAVYRILCIHLGNPPSAVDWQWRDSEGKFHRDGELTPLDFADRYISTDYRDMVCLVNDPRPDHPYFQTYTISYLGNVVGARSVRYLNVPSEVLKDITLRQLQDGRPVWMGCDTGKQNHRKLGLWDADLFDYGAVYGSEFEMDKATRLEYGQTQMTHAMLFTGVDVVEGNPRRWRVENSYGSAVGDKGFFLMNDSWFDEYMFEIAAPRKYLSQDLLAALDTDPIPLPPWDPMGALAE